MAAAIVAEEASFFNLVANEDNLSKKRVYQLMTGPEKRRLI